MPLITSTTALNKLKWGNDRFNAGMTDGSNQPYIRRDIPGVNVDNPNPTLFNDGGDLPAKTGIDVLLRNGFQAPADALRDVSRLTQMMFDVRTPNGLLFIAAQNVLSRTAVKTEASYGIGYGGVTPPNFINGNGGGAVNAGIYTPLGTLAQAGVGFTGTHLNLMGLDPTSPMTGVVQGGLFPGAGLNTYLGTIRGLNNDATFSTKNETYTKKIANPLYPVYNNLPLILGSGGTGQGGPEPATIDVELTRRVSNDQSDFDNRLANLLKAKIDTATNDVNIISYSGGPGSILGIGNTKIRFADQRTGINNPLFVKDPQYFLGTSGKDHYNLNPQSKDYISKLGASIYAQKTFRTKLDKDFITEETDDTKLANVNNFQSTIRNAQLSNNGFFDDVQPENAFTTDQIDNYNIFFRPDTQITYTNKLGASPKAVELLPLLSNEDLKNEFLEEISQNVISNQNITQTTIRNAELENLNFFTVGDDMPNDYAVFFRPSVDVNYTTKLATSLKAEALFPEGSDEYNSLIEAKEQAILSRENTPQSAIRNSELTNGIYQGFFSPELPNNYSVFRGKPVVYNAEMLAKIYTVGTSAKFVEAFEGSDSAIYENLNTKDSGGLYRFFNNVYEANLISVGKGAKGRQWDQNTWTYTQAQLEGYESNQSPSIVVEPKIQDFRKTIIDANDITTSSVLSFGPSYTAKSADRRINRGNPGKKIDVFNYGVPATQTAALDKLTAMPMYDSNGPNGNLAINDFVKFRIAAINNEPDALGSAVYMHFRAFIDSFSDNYNAGWDPIKYSGRGENLYNYTGFERSINMSFTCFAQSKAELIPMYKKLNYLASTLAPDYTSAGFMRGNLVRLTLGGYLYEQPGFISSLTYDIPQESPWEISINAEGGGDGSVKELPHMIKVSQLTFTPIHNFLPQKPNVANNPDERYIALSNAFNSRGNYADDYALQIADGDGDENSGNNIIGE